MVGNGFASRLKELREQAGLSQKGLAERAGLALSAIGHLEQGLRKPTWESVQALADALGISCDAFREGLDSQKPASGRGRPRKADSSKPASQEKPTDKTEKRRGKT